MVAFASLPLVGRLVGAPGTPVVDLPPVDIHDIETAVEHNPRALKYLVRANHVNYALVTEQGPHRYNYMAHALCASYLLGASHQQLHALYDAFVGQLESWIPSPAEVAELDWRDFFGDRAYQRAYVDHFEDIVAEHSVAYAWRKVVHKYLLAGPDPLVNCLIGGLGHPLVHLAYAYEMDSRIIAMEALSSAAVSYSFLHRYTDDPSYTRPPPAELDALDGPSPLAALLARVTQDDRFDAASLPAGATAADVATFDASLTALFAAPAVEAALLEYWNAWAVVATTDLTRQFRDAQDTAIALFVSSVPSGTHRYSLLLSHVLAASHAARVLLPHLPAYCHVPVLRQWWLLTLAVYVAVGRPTVGPANVPANSSSSSSNNSKNNSNGNSNGNGNTSNRGWSYVETRARDGCWNMDAHFLRSVRAMREAAKTWGNEQEQYLHTAVRFVDDFEGWTH